jgi:hypothetical protein
VPHCLAFNYKFKNIVERQWLTPVILATQEAEIRRILVGSQPYLKKTLHTLKKGLVEWLKV